MWCVKCFFEPTLQTISGIQMWFVNLTNVDKRIFWANLTKCDEVKCFSNNLHTNCGCVKWFKWCKLFFEPTAQSDVKTYQMMCKVFNDVLFNQMWCRITLNNLPNDVRFFELTTKWIGYVFNQTLPTLVLSNFTMMWYVFFWTTLLMWCGVMNVM
jgi:hypothetical protein